MREVLKSNWRWLRSGLLALSLFALPNCILHTEGYGDGKPTGECEKPGECKPPDCDPDDLECQPPCEGPDCEPPCDTPDCMVPPDTHVFDPGVEPVSSAIMCDFPKPVKANVSTCATQAEADAGISLTAAATALANGQSSSIALDWSSDALAECAGLPKKIEYLGPFPDGSTVCLNCGTQIPAVYATPAKACIAQCTDLIAFGSGPFPSEGAAAYCAAHARTSTNFDKNACYDGACSSGGTPLPGFVDPRREQEKVKWVDHIGTTDNGGSNSLTRSSSTPGGMTEYSAGAASAQTIISGDAWVELQVSEADKAHALSLRTSCADAFNCPDVDPALETMGSSLFLAKDGFVYVLENNPSLVGFGPFGPYTAGERFRVRAIDNHDGKATISFSRIIGTCVPGSVCTEDVFYTAAFLPQYPLRVDAALGNENASLVNVTLVRIQQ